MSKQSERLARLRAELAELTSDEACVAFSVDVGLPQPLTFARCDPNKRICGRCGGGKIPAPRAAKK